MLFKRKPLLRQTSVAAGAALALGVSLISALLARVGLTKQLHCCANRSADQATAFGGIHL